MKAIRDHKIGGLIVLSFLALAMVPAAQAKNTLRCMVVDEAGNPLDKQELRVTLTQTGKEWKRKTNNKGEVQFKGLNDGAYQIEGHELQDYFTKPSDPVELSGNITHPCNLTFVSVEFMNGLLQAGMQAAQQSNFDLAIEKGKEAVNWSPDMAQGHYVVSIGYAAQGMRTEAEEAINKAAEIDPENFQKLVTQVLVSAIGVQANQAESNGDFDAAMGKYEEILQISPNDANAYYNIALAHGRKKDYQQALEFIDKSIAANPADAEVRKMKARLQDLYLKEMDSMLELK